jgi:NitT/TauT family transport system ATP-binding protein
LDYQTRLQLCDDVFDIIKKEQKTAILVTHDLMEAITMSDRIVVLSSRPGTVKAIHKTHFDPKLTPFERRQQDEAKKLFEVIWQEIQNENQNTI